MTGRGSAVVVEADDKVRACLSEMLQQSGLDVYQASSSDEGVEAVRKHDPVIITMDVDLPGFDGFEAARRIRTFSKAYLIMIAGSIAEEDVLMGLASGLTIISASHFDHTNYAPGSAPCCDGPVPNRPKCLQ